MKQYHIAQKGVKKGQFPEDEIISKVLSGELKGSDLCWTSGMQAWAQIKTVFTLPPKLPPAQAATQSTTLEPWFVYVPMTRFVLMSIFTLGLYNIYWIYKNWKYLKTRDTLKIKPFWRGIFGYFYIYGILKKIKEDTLLTSKAGKTFSPGIAAIGWITLCVIGSVLGRVNDLNINLLGLILSLPAFLFLIPAQQFINSANESRKPQPKFVPWTTGHIVVLVVGLILSLLVLAAVILPDELTEEAPNNQNTTVHIHYTEPVASLQGVDPQKDITAIENLKGGGNAEKTANEIQAHPENFSPPVLSMLGKYLFDKGQKDLGMFWFYAGQVRGRYDANRCADISARQAVDVITQALGSDINQYAFQDKENLKETVQRVVEWSLKTPHNYDHRWINLHGMGAFVESGQPISLPETEWESIRQQTHRDYLTGLNAALK